MHIDLSTQPRAGMSAAGRVVTLLWTASFGALARSVGFLVTLYVLTLLAAVFSVFPVGRAGGRLARLSRGGRLARLTARTQLALWECDWRR